MTNAIRILQAMRPEAKYQVTVRGPVPADLDRKIAEAHASAIRNRPPHAVNLAQLQAMPVRRHPRHDQATDGSEIDSEGIDGGEQP